MGLDFGSVGLSTTLSIFCDADILSHLIDASPNFPNATIFDNSSTTGLGGWGDPNNDYQITTGAFAHDFEVAYPVPHGIRRNYTVRDTNPDPFGDGTPPGPDDLWTYFTPASQKAMVEGYVGDFWGFQALFEGTIVSQTSTDDRDRRVGRRSHSRNSANAIASRC